MHASKQGAALLLVDLPQLQASNFSKSCNYGTSARSLQNASYSQLEFVAQAVPAGSLFTRRLIALSAKVTKLHYRIKLNKEARRDTIRWQEFLPSWNGTAKFITEDADVRDLDLYTDASGKYGCGTYYKGAH